MLGLVRERKYEESQRRLTNALIVKTANDIKINELESKLKLEIAKSTYWKIKSENLTANVVVVGSIEEIAYIKDEIKC